MQDYSSTTFVRALDIVCLHAELLMGVAHNDGIRIFQPSGWGGDTRCSDNRGSTVLDSIYSSIYILPLICIWTGVQDRYIVTCMPSSFYKPLISLLRELYSACFLVTGTHAWTLLQKHKFSFKGWKSDLLVHHFVPIVYCMSLLNNVHYYYLLKLQRFFQTKEWHHIIMTTDQKHTIIISIVLN